MKNLKEKSFEEKRHRVLTMGLFLWSFRISAWLWCALRALNGDMIPLAILSFIEIGFLFFDLVSESLFYTAEDFSVYIKFNANDSKIKLFFAFWAAYLLMLIEPTYSHRADFVYIAKLRRHSLWGRWIYKNDLDN